MNSILGRRVSLAAVVASCAVAFAACGGDDDALSPGGGDDDDDLSSSGTNGRDGGSSSSSSGRPSSSSSSGSSSSSSSGSSSSSSSSGSAPTFAVGGSLLGLTGPSLVLQNNAANDLTVTADGPFTFTQRLVDDAAYAVSVLTQPVGNRCTVQAGTGTIDGADIGNVAVTCVPAYSVGGTAQGLTMPIVLGNGEVTTTVSTNGPFTLQGELVSGDPYNVVIVEQPKGQVCALGDWDGVIGSANVTNVRLICRDLALAINEVYARPASGHWGDSNADGVRSGTEDEFVEIMNDEDFEVSIAGLMLKTTGGAGVITRATFPAGTTLPAKGRAVVFGGGAATGAFGGAPTFTGSLLLSDAPATFTVQLAASDTFSLATYTYGAADFGNTCSTACTSRTRTPEDPSGTMQPHNVVAGVLHSPGTSQATAVPKLLPAFSLPAASAAGASLTTFFRAQLNMAMNTAELQANLTLSAAACNAAAVPVAGNVVLENGNSAGRFTPTAPLAFATTYCLGVGAVHGAAGAPLDATIPTSVQFLTRAAISAPATGVVISQIGGAFAAPHREFVELYNASDVAVDVSGWFVQRRAAGGGTNCFATLPAATSIAPHAFYLIGGAGYADGAAVAADFIAAPGTALVGNNESVVLLSGGSCGSATPALEDRVDAVSYGTITDSFVGLYLPALPGPIVAIRRKACFDTTGDADATTGYLGGHADDGNSEHIGASDADFLALPAAAPRNAAAAAQVRACN